MTNHRASDRLCAHFIHIGAIMRSRELLLSFCLAAPAAPAHAQSCDLALILGYDASSSVDSGEYRQQLDGIAWALREPEVTEAILLNGGVYLAAYEWSGRFQQVLVADWTWLESAQVIDRFAARIAAQNRRFSKYPTSIGYALAFAGSRFRTAPAGCSRYVVDLSGDGAHNDGFSPATAYRNFEFENVTVNGLVIAGASPDPVAYYKDNVIRGPGAFVEVADGYENYAVAMKRKLLREIGNRLVSSFEP